MILHASNVYLISYYIYIIRKTQKTEENYSTKKERPVKDEA